MPFSLSPVRIGVALLSGALATGIFHVTQQGVGTSAIAAALGVPEPSSVARAANAGTAGPHAGSSSHRAPAARARHRPEISKIQLASALPAKAGNSEAAVDGPKPASRRSRSEKPDTAAAEVKVAKAAPAAKAGSAVKKSGTLAMTKAPKRIVFRHSSPGVIVLTLQGDQLDVEFKEGR